jgi:hypothetical protein
MGDRSIAELTVFTDIAQTSLAEIILRLNTGLVSIITSFLNNDKHGGDLDYHSLTDLSERSRKDTCTTLRGLFKRMTQIRRPLPAPPRDSKPVNDRRKANTQSKKRPTSVKPTRVRRPMLAQVVIENSSQPPQIAMVRPSDRRKKSSSGSSSLSKGASETSSGLSTPLPSPPPEYTPLNMDRPAIPRIQSDTNVPRPRQQPAPLDGHNPAGRISSRAARSTPRLDSTLPPPGEPAPPLPNMAAVSSMDLGSRRRKPTPTYYSIASDQTKIGEIPLHKWTEPYDFDQMSIMNRQAYQNGWPLSELDQQNARKKRFGLGRLFGRKST